ncbi:MAG: hypothetical protein Faunusvirus7_13 [Faunusvirus sp.]|jgi:hypothetical protein|uniref:Uncharacterized protein n=1 Tax=Faunusvirus sp. TaxID=2487766 RepID=A0A3G4ZWK1_9VIRU|nr:MAG: hypothetical protein Faunusvirus7_13 [Faunusvirus sp.]
MISFEQVCLNEDYNQIRQEIRYGAALTQQSLINICGNNKDQTYTFRLLPLFERNNIHLTPTCLYNACLSANKKMIKYMIDKLKMKATPECLTALVSNRDVNSMYIRKLAFNGGQPTVDALHSALKTDYWRTSFLITTLINYGAKPDYNFLTALLNNKTYLPVAIRKVINVIRPDQTCFDILCRRFPSAELIEQFLQKNKYMKFDADTIGMFVDILSDATSDAKRTDTTVKLLKYEFPFIVKYYIMRDVVSRADDKLDYQPMTDVLTRIFQFVEFDIVKLVIDKIVIMTDGVLAVIKLNNQHINALIQNKTHNGAILNTSLTQLINRGVSPDNKSNLLLKKQKTSNTTGDYTTTIDMIRNTIGNNTIVMSGKKN